MRFDRYGMGRVSFLGSKHFYPVLLRNALIRWKEYGKPEGKQYTYILTALCNCVNEWISNHVICTPTCKSIKWNACSLLISTWCRFKIFYNIIFHSEKSSCEEKEWPALTREQLEIGNVLCKWKPNDLYNSRNWNCWLTRKLLNCLLHASLLLRKA